MKNCTIYKIECIENGRVYVGSTNMGVTRRWASHLSCLRRGTHGNSILQRSWDKYGESAFRFEELETCNEPFRMFYEQDWMERLGARRSRGGFNLVESVDAGYLNCLTPEERREISLKRSIETGEVKILYDRKGREIKFQSVVEFLEVFDVDRHVLSRLKVDKVHLKNKWFPDYSSYLRWRKRKDCVYAFGRAKEGDPVLLRKRIPKRRVLVYSPKGVLTVVTGLREFCRDNGLNYKSFSRMLSGRAKEHLGWRLTKEKPERRTTAKTRTFISPEGEAVIVRGLAELDKLVGANAKGLYQRRSKSQRGWSYEGAYCELPVQYYDPSTRGKRWRDKKGRNRPFEEWHVTGLNPSNVKKMARFTLESPDGERVECHGVRQTADRLGLSRQGLIDLRAGRRESFKGWRIAA